MTANTIFNDIFEGYARERYDEHEWSEKVFNEVLAALAKMYEEQRWIIMKTYEAWVMMNADNDVITGEHDTPQGAVNELKDRYTIEEMHEAGFTCNKLLCSNDAWLECLDEIDY